ncbi:MAG: hypothetical protein H7333_05470, partial [Bdellovibrionales bacterium]|nr:hypothetical protein [Oligoflexia bacterium]
MKCALNYPSILTLASFFLFSACGAQKVPNGVTTTGDARLNTADPLTEVLHPGDEVRDPEQADVPIKSELVKPLALIYKGPGACSLDQDDAGESGYGCSEAAADVAT